MPTVRMNINIEARRGAALFIGAHPPGQGTGPGIRSLIILQALRSRFESVEVVAFASGGEASLADPSTVVIPRPAPASRAEIAASLRHGGVYFAPERQVRLGQRVRDLVRAGTLRGRYDVLWVHQSLMAGAADSVSAAVRVLDVDTVVGPVMRDRAASVDGRSKRLYARLHAAVASREERRRWSRFDHLVVASENELERLGRWKERATVIPNAVPAPETDGESQGRQVKPPIAGHPDPTADILFVGSLDYSPNVEAASSLIRSILPLIRSARGPTTAMIAGRHPRSSLVRLCEAEDVRLVAGPPSMSPVYAGARVFAAPLAHGGGTKIKMIEAMAHGLPIVASPVAAEGLELRQGHNAFIHDTPDEFAAACVELLGNASLADRVAEAARETWSRHHHPEAVKASIASLLDRLCPSQ